MAHTLAYRFVHLALLAGVTSLSGGCPEAISDDDPPGDGDGQDDDDDGPAHPPADTSQDTAEATEDGPATVAGHVIRLATTPLAADDDGVGTLYIAALETCDLTAPLLGSAVIPNADFSQPEARVGFEIPDLSQPVHLAVFLDDDLNADPQAPTPDPGDLSYAEQAGDGILSCIVANPTESALVEVPLTALVPGAVR
ncbi:MAG: hypothetical protein B7733_12070 [Myxococcales bacterium FL481]|nr:MAG: hypothetical protein B7733_12070 [Myxococcales bacterium FL481]